MSKKSELTPTEQRVMRDRFGIGLNGADPAEQADPEMARRRTRIRETEARANKVLKGPGVREKLQSILKEH